jgi:hypothetical protein
VKRTLSRIPVLSALSVLLLVTVLVLWVRSPWRADLLMFYTPAGHLTGIASDETGFLLAATDVPFGERFALSADVLTGTREQLTDGIRDPLFKSASERRHLLGFHWARGTFGTTGWKFSALIVPYWAVAILLAVLPLIAARRVVVGWRRTRRGQCVRCGYDLRATPDRCPECGRAAAETRGGPAQVARARIASWVLVALMLAVAVAAIVRGRRAALTQIPEPKTVLDRRIAEVELDNLSLEAAVGRLSKLSGAPIAMTSAVASTAADYRVPLILPLHLRLCNVSLATALGLVADAASVRNLDLTFGPQPDGGILLQDKSTAKPILSVHDIADLPHDLDLQALAQAGVSRWRLTQDTWGFPRPGDPQLIRLGRRLAVVATWHDQAQIAAAFRRLRKGGGQTEASAAILGAIDKQVGPIDVRDMPLAEVIDVLGGRAGINLVVDWSTFAPGQRSARRDRLITMHMARQPLRGALDNLFREPGDPIRFTYTVEDNVLIVSAAPVFH